MTVAEYLTEKIAKSGKSQLELARQAGLPRPNLISMMKKGITRVPLARIPALALALGISQEELMGRCLAEYQPGLLEALQTVYGIALTLPEASGGQS